MAETAKAEQELVGQIIQFRANSTELCPHGDCLRLRQDCSLCWSEFIRSHTDALVAAAYLAAGKWLRNRDTDRKLEPDEYRWLDGLAAHIEGMTSAAAAAELERVKAAVRSESEAQKVIELIEKECGTDVAWHLGKITNDRWFGHPHGRGYTVTLNVPNSDRAIFEKRDTLTQAAEKAIVRAKQRIAELAAAAKQ